MFRILQGLFLGYFVYTKSGRDSLENIGNKITKSAKEMFKKDDKKQVETKPNAIKTDIDK